MRRFMIPAALGLAVLAGSGAVANDQIYKCIDANGTTMLSDKPCAIVEAVPADSSSATGAVSDLPLVGEDRPQVTKEYFTLPAAEIDHGQRTKVQLVSTPPKVDVATLKAARLKLELEDKTASLRQASLD
ncbi:DUF4124 domain-containing protein [Pseudoduganella albidiflava]|uniref:DUF4124 domain-containing protein n=1 Tax=Pseudoduganella albidiflava TaxID=321983 RepID=A0A411X2N8_9BURK|nr:DUF4124 domain-containing protein [Pseudoduganella albidiflava]QBI03204.1 DUF4124 domain-containing protein [Pseudoduganella albidiflava]GGY64395.1 hypothetical protein GCM10007387_53470 [Pseudoduganella albidiflava]